MIRIEINAKQLSKAIKGLPMVQRAKLIQELTQTTWEKRFDQLLSRIRARVKKYPITQEEIDHEVEEAKKDYHAQNRR